MSGKGINEMQSRLKLCTRYGDFLTCEMLNEFAFHVYISRNNFWKRKSLSINSPFTTTENKPKCTQ